MFHVIRAADFLLLFLTRVAFCFFLFFYRQPDFYNVLQKSVNSDQHILILICT